MNKLSKCLEKCAKYDDRENSAILCCKMLVRAKNARACAWARFFIKCSIWPETYAKKIWDDLEHFKFLRARKRADERARAHLRTFFDLKLTGRILILIVIIMNEKLLFRYEDMIISWFSQNGAWMTSRWLWVFEKSRSSKLD